MPNLNLSQQKNGSPCEVAAIFIVRFKILSIPPRVWCRTGRGRNPDSM